ncbi:hypothetical protein BX600DRAFT_197980 [Xylariales sp. PMI_506]|nr:hypothetical protein BX600DRAFT_197980 [Xylariales sp. PMI_506]
MQLPLVAMLLLKVPHGQGAALLPPDTTSWILLRIAKPEGFPSIMLVALHFENVSMAPYHAITRPMCIPSADQCHDLPEVFAHCCKRLPMRYAIWREVCKRLPDIDYTIGETHDWGPVPQGAKVAFLNGPGVGLGDSGGSRFHQSGNWVIVE